MDESTARPFSGAAIEGAKGAAAMRGPAHGGLLLRPMASTRRRPAILVCDVLRVACYGASLALLLLTGCRTDDQQFPRIINEPAPLSSELRASFGRVGILPVAASSNLNFTRPLLPSQVAERMSYKSFIQIDQMLRDPERKPQEHSGRVAFTTLVTMSIDALPGFVAGVPESDFRQAQSRLRAAMDVNSVESGIDMQLGRIYLKRRLANTALLPPEALNDIQLRGFRADLSRLKAAGIDTVLDVRVSEMGFEYEPGTNPELTFTPQVTIYVLRVKDGSVAYASYLDYRGTKHRLLEWAANDANAFRIELDLAAHAFTDALLEQYFGLNPRETQGAAPAE